MPGPHARRPSIVDVAAVAGVSYQTVSRVINDSGPVAEPTRRRILAAVAELGFHPSSAARALVTGRGSVIGVMTAGTLLHGYASTLSGIEHAARATGRSVTMIVLPATPGADSDAAVARLLSQPLFGVIALTHDESGTAALRALPGRVPAVAVGGDPRTQRPRATVDERAGAAAATRYLLDLGHSTVHHLGIGEIGTGHRHAGRSDALRAAGRSVPATVPVTWEPRSAHLAGLDLAGRRDVTAVLCDNDELAIALVSALTSRGRRVPEDISVVGFDDHPLAEFARPALTTVRQDFVRLGHTAVALLGQVADEEIDPADSVAEATLVIRDSAGRPRA